MASKNYLNFEYKPISLDEWLAPAMAATQYQRDLEDKYLQLQSEVNAWEKIKSNEADASLYENVYKPYVEAIQNSAIELTSKGSNPNSRKKLYELTSQYNSIIKPIEEGYNKREAAQKQWLDAYFKNSNLVIEKEPNSYSIEDYIKFGDEIQPKIIDKEATYRNAIASFTPLAQTIRKSPQWSSTHGYWEIRQERGYTPEEVYKAMVDPSNADPMLQAAVTNVIKSSNAFSWDDPTAAINHITPVINQALTYALGKSDYDYKANLEYQASLTGTKSSKGGKNDGLQDLRYPAVTIAPRTKRQALDKDFEFNEIRKDSGRWIIDNKVITSQDTKDKLDKAAMAFPYLDPAESVEMYSMLERKKSLVSHNAAVYHAPTASEHDQLIEAIISVLETDVNTNLYTKNGNPLKEKHEKSLISDIRDGKMNNINLFVNEQGLGIQVGDDYYYTTDISGESRATGDFKRVSQIASAVYDGLTNFYGDAPLVSSIEEASELLKTVRPDPKTGLTHIRYRTPSENVENLILDTRTSKVYTSSIDDVIYNDGYNLNMTLHDLYKNLLYNFAHSHKGTKVD